MTSVYESFNFKVILLTTVACVRAQDGKHPLQLAYRARGSKSVCFYREANQPVT